VQEESTATPPFVDRTSRPSREEVLAGLGPARQRWLRLEDWVRATYGIDGELIYAGREAGWSLRFRRAGKALFTLLPRADEFGALVVVGPRAWVGAAKATLSPATRDAWAHARPYPDGRWLWFTVADDQTANDIEQLVALKSPPLRRPRRAVARPA